MGRDLADGWPAAAEVFAEADAALGWSVSDVAWNGPAERLNETQQTQPCLVADLDRLPACAGGGAGRGERRNAGAGLRGRPLGG